MLRPFICAIVTVVAISCYQLLKFTTLGSSLKFLPMSEPTWSSIYSGYLHRADPHPNPKTFTPIRSALELVVLRNSQVEHEGIDLAIFSDRTVIDSKGGVRILKEHDFEGIMELGRLVNDLPTTGGFRNQWRVQHDRTGRPIDRILYAGGKLSPVPRERYEEEYTETSVYGFDKHRIRLEERVGSFTTLAPPLWELVGLAMEARESEREEDVAVLNKLKAVLGNVY
ncbi:hypothetical protein M413DRAFT_446923 [Hebeloma cylindrosporum]|uniref:Uncharacterized protein n=1 Tax=Hebeloma cylindrosporum TaxID=76867 RepID=A0A0C2YEE8_HEBCY|nr:hypothetical protein M413DRAFT_446923 [Hebeloma cylindrosporum h7]